MPEAYAMTAFADVEAGEAAASRQLVTAGGAALGKCETMFGESGKEVTLVYRRLTVRSRMDPEKVLLDGVSGTLAPGFTALMGPSGAGKTTLLCALALRLDNATAEGQLLANGETYTRRDLKQLSGFVTQDDVLPPNLTVREALAFSAALLMPADWGAPARAARVAEVIAEVGLARAANTVVGGAARRGVSGGERKRASVALELLTRPRLLFLDEPTSGLDSTTALAICALLRDMSARRGTNVVVTIHQPSAKIFATFSSVLLLRAGGVAFHGAPGALAPFLAARGFPCPPGQLLNPCDHALDALADAPPGTFTLADDDDDGAGKAPPAAPAPMRLAPRRRPSWGRQYAVLARRHAREATRAWRAFLVVLAVNAGMGLLLGGYGFSLPNDETGVTERVRFLFFCCITMGVFGAMGVVFSFPAERQLSLKERASGAYGASPYYLAKATVDVATYLPGPVVFSCCVYFLVGFQATAAKFFVFTGVMCLTTMATCALALATSALCRTVAVSVVVLPLLLEASRLCSGFYTWPAVQTPRWAWLDALSYVSYNYPSLLQNELAGLELSCSAAAPCPPPYAYVVKAGYAQRTIGENCLALAGYTLICHAAAYCGIRWLKH